MNENWLVWSFCILSVIINKILKVPGPIASDFSQTFRDFGIRRKLIFFSLPLVNFTAEKCTVWKILNFHSEKSDQVSLIWIFCLFKTSTLLLLYRLPGTLSQNNPVKGKWNKKANKNAKSKQTENSRPLLINLQHYWKS